MFFYFEPNRAEYFFSKREDLISDLTDTQKTKIRKLTAQLNIAKAQKNKHLVNSLEKEILTIEY